LLSIWFHGHNNPRYAELLPRLERLDACLVRLSKHRAVRGLQFRAFWASRPALYQATLRPSRSRYAGLLTLDPNQIPAFRGPVVADIDDPYFNDRHVALLNRPNVKAYAVTAEHAARRYEALGVDKPWIVIPQGVSLGSVTPEGKRDAALMRRPGDVVVGWMAAHLLSAGDRDADGPLYNVDHLLELWDAIRARLPHGRLWLVGEASARVRRRVAGRDDIVLFGRLPRAQALATAANFDLAVYARTRDTGIRAAKVAEFIGLGVPTVSYDYEVTANLRELGAGVLVATPRDFVDAIVRLAEDAEARGTLAAAAVKAGRDLDWDLLAQRLERELLDRYLPKLSA
jgi:glycosyltransferase involved in cell wall biosynthesis